MTITLDLGTVSCEMEKDSDTGRFVAFNDEVRAVAVGDTPEEAVTNFYASLRDLVDYCLANGLAIPSVIAAGRSTAS